MLKRFFTALLLVCLITLAAAPAAHAVQLRVDNTVLYDNIQLYNDTTYVPLRTVSQLLSPDAKISWSQGTAQVRSSSLTLTARPGDTYIEANGRYLYVPDGVKLVNGTTLLPVRILSKAFGAAVSWNAGAQTAVVKSGSGTISSGSRFYDSDAVYWLSRIIHSESGGEPLEGKIAVGNVILNRVESRRFPNTIYEVIFDKNGGTQFQPVSNGTIYDEPSEESILAAKLCLDGAVAADGVLFFLNPKIATSFWIVENRDFVKSIGNHAFYS